MTCAPLLPLLETVDIMAPSHVCLHCSAGAVTVPYLSNMRRIEVQLQGETSLAQQQRGRHTAATSRYKVSPASVSTTVEVLGKNCALLLCCYDLNPAAPSSVPGKVCADAVANADHPPGLCHL